VPAVRENIRAGVRGAIRLRHIRTGCTRPEQNLPATAKTVVLPRRDDTWNITEALSEGFDSINDYQSCDGFGRRQGAYPPDTRGVSDTRRQRICPDHSVAGVSPTQRGAECGFERRNTPPGNQPSAPRIIRPLPHPVDFSGQLPAAITTKA